MLNKRGFTLVEMLCSFSILIVMSTFSLTFSRGKNDHSHEFYQSIQSLIEEARMEALTRHCPVYIDITEQTIGYRNAMKSRRVQLPPTMHFEQIKNIHFNENGTVNQGNHIVLIMNKITYWIIFHVGSGDFYLQKQ